MAKFRASTGISITLLFISMIVLLCSTTEARGATPLEAGLQKRSGNAPHEAGGSSSAAKDKGKGKQVMVEEKSKYANDPKMAIYTSSDESNDHLLQLGIMRSLQEVDSKASDIQGSDSKSYPPDYDPITETYFIDEAKYDELPPYRHFFKKQWNASENMLYPLDKLDHDYHKQKYEFYSLVLLALQSGDRKLIKKVWDHYRARLDFLKFDAKILKLSKRKELVSRTIKKMNLWKAHKPRPCDVPSLPDEMADHHLDLDYDSDLDHEYMEEEELLDDEEALPSADKKGKGKIE